MEGGGGEDQPLFCSGPTLSADLSATLSKFSTSCIYILFSFSSGGGSGGSICILLWPGPVC